MAKVFDLDKFKTEQAPKGNSRSPEYVNEGVHSCRYLWSG